MPLELQNILCLFQQTMEATLAMIKGQFTLEHLVNTFVVSRSAAEQVDHLKHVLINLHKAEATLNWKKCIPVSKRIVYLGNVMSIRCLETVHHKTNAIKGLEPPWKLSLIEPTF